MKALYLEHLAQNAKGGCATPNCKHDHSLLFLVSRCHPHGKVSAAFEVKTGLLHITCAACEKPIIKLHVAKQNAVNFNECYAIRHRDEEPVAYGNSVISAWQAAKDCLGHDTIKQLQKQGYEIVRGRFVP